VITVKRLAGLLGVTFRAADTAVHLLLQAGILTERTGIAATGCSVPFRSKATRNSGAVAAFAGKVSKMRA